MKEVNPKVKIFWIAIMEPGEWMVRRSYKIKEDVLTYNNILKSEAGKCGFEIIDAFEGEYIIQDFLLEDGHHLNALGNERLF